MNDITSPLKAIRAKCIKCSGDQVGEVKDCSCHACPLYPFRMGKNPYHKKLISDEQRLRLAENARKNLHK